MACATLFPVAGTKLRERDALSEWTKAASGLVLSTRPPTEAAREQSMTRRSIAFGIAIITVCGLVIWLAFGGFVLLSPQEPHVLDREAHA